jgi:multiple sugar transport system substrate-binding protein
MKHKKMVLAAGVVLTAALGAAALVHAQSGVTKVSVWFHSGQGSERDALNAIIKKFNASSKDTMIEAVQLPEGSYDNQVNAAALAGSLPCVLDFDGPNLYNYAWSGKLLPIDKYVDAATRKDFVASIIRQGTYNGKLYSLGQFESGLALWGNKKLLAAAGIKVPTRLSQAWTGEQFTAALDKLQKMGEKYPLDMKFNYGKGWFIYGIAPIMQSFGGDLINRKGYQTADSVLNGADAVTGMKYFQTLSTKYANVGTKVDTDFVEGKSAISLVGHWVYPDYSKALGKDLALIPMPKFGKRIATGSGSWNFGISSDCKVPDAAAKVLLDFVSSESVLTMTNANGAVPSRKSALRKSKNYAAGGALKLYADQLNAGVSIERPVTPAFPAIANAFNDAADNIARGGDVKAELDKAVKAIDQDIKDNNGYPVK